MFIFTLSGLSMNYTNKFVFYKLYGYYSKSSSAVIQDMIYLFLESILIPKSILNLNYQWK